MLRKIQKLGVIVMLSLLLTVPVGSGVLAASIIENGSSHEEVLIAQDDNRKTLEYFNVRDHLQVTDQKNDQILKKFTVTGFIIKVIDLLVKILGSVAMIVLIIGGLILIASGGNEQQLETGKNTLKYGIIGLAIALSSFLIITFVNNFLSIE